MSVLSVLLSVVNGDEDVAEVNELVLVGSFSSMFIDLSEFITVLSNDILMRSDC